MPAQCWGRPNSRIPSRTVCCPDSWCWLEQAPTPTEDWQHQLTNSAVGPVNDIPCKAVQCTAVVLWCCSAVVQWCTVSLPSHLSTTSHSHHYHRSPPSSPPPSPLIIGFSILHLDKLNHLVQAIKIFDDNTIFPPKLTPSHSSLIHPWWSDYQHVGCMKLNFVTFYLLSQSLAVTGSQAQSDGNSGW